MKLKFIIPLSLLPFLIWAQETDSLLAQYQSYPNDTSKVTLLYNKGYALRNIDLISAGKFSQACCETAVLCKSHKYLAKALNFRGILKAQTGFNKEAAIDLERSLLLSIQTKDTLGELSALNNLGNVYEEIDETEKAFACYKSSLSLANKSENDFWVKGNLLGIAALELKLKMYAQAEGNFETILGMCDFKGEQEIISICDLNLGLCKYYQGDFLAAEACQLQALDEMQMMEDDLGECDACANLAEIYFAKKDLAACFSSLQKSLAIAEKNKYGEGLLKTWKVLSDYYKEINKSEEALVYLAKHDSVLVANRNTVDLRLNTIWNKNDAGNKKTEAIFYSLRTIFQVLIIGLLIIVVLFVFKNKTHEQKE
jgi:tetratricopeptide (TPR) repeat protein